jgi:hypothetical protein
MVGNWHSIRIGLFVTLTCRHGRHTIKMKRPTYEILLPGRRYAYLCSPDVCPARHCAPLIFIRPCVGLLGLAPVRLSAERGPLG